MNAGRTVVRPRADATPQSSRAAIVRCYSDPAAEFVKIRYKIAYVVTRIRDQPFRNVTEKKQRSFRADSLARSRLRANALISRAAAVPSAGNARRVVAWCVSRRPDFRLDLCLRAPPCPLRRAPLNQRRLSRHQALGGQVFVRLGPTRPQERRNQRAGPRWHASSSTICRA